MSNSLEIFNKITKNSSEAVWVYDERTYNKDLIFSSYEEALKYKDVLRECIDEKTISGKSGNYVTLRLDDTYRIIIKNADHAIVRKELCGDTTDYRYKVAFKVAEFHGYVQFTDMKTDLSKAIGASTDKPGSFSGNWIVRDDGVYDEKYFRGDHHLEPGQQTLMPDKASISIEFFVKDEQFKQAIDSLSEHHKSIDENNNSFHFVTNNCHDYTHKVYQELAFSGHPMHFVRSENLDFNDQGICSYFLKAQSWGMFTQNIGLLSKAVQQYIPEAPSLGIGWYWDYYTTYSVDDCDSYGNNGLHRALINKDIATASKYLDEVSNPDAKNLKGETALHLAAKLKPSPEKLEFLQKLLSKVGDVNPEDLHSDNIPLTFAVKADDPDAIDLLVEHGANLHFVTPTNDCLGNIAAEYGAKKSAAKLFELEETLLVYDAGNRQLPIHHPKIAEVLPTPKDAPEPKNEIEEHNKIPDLYAFLHELLSPLVQEEFQQLHSF
ncbi:MAG: ankyrin repeat-containing protein [Candidatus Midichloriaceae bacterium]|jgi:hypothetical protein|nr:ankyrin repeat-containing protein [Candidatus Midichloriaceae bacterium]